MPNAKPIKTVGKSTNVRITLVLAGIASRGPIRLIPTEIAAEAIKTFKIKRNMLAESILVILTVNGGLTSLS
jgi:hypothetical protein